MKITSRVRHGAQLTETLLELSSEVVISTSVFSKTGEILLDELSDISQRIRKYGKRVILEWDILMTDAQFLRCKEQFANLDCDLFDAIRVQDYGASWYLYHETKLPLQLKLENGNHNLEAFKIWNQVYGVRVEKFILSPELPLDKVEAIRSSVETPLEMLGYGKLLLFYTPRNLLTPYLKEQVGTLYASSEESPHKGFFVLQNYHGTQMFHPRELYILDELSALKKAQVDFLRVDYSFMEDVSQGDRLLIHLHGCEMGNLQNMRQEIGSTFKGFFKNNKTDILFKKLKNTVQKTSEEGAFVGVVLEAMKERHLCLDLRESSEVIKPGDILKFITPEGRKKEMTLRALKDSGGTSLATSEGKSIVFIPHIKGTAVRTYVYK